jgi:hypothetical protein
MLHDEWFSSLPISEFIASKEEALFRGNPYMDAAEIVGVFPELKRKVIMRMGMTKWELYLKEGKTAMRLTCASPWGDHLVSCAEYMYGIPPDGWKITKKVGDANKRRADTERSRSTSQEETGTGKDANPGED